MTFVDNAESFSAYIKCQTPGFEGFWDRHIIKEEEGPEVRFPTPYLIVNNYCNFSDVPSEERCLFHFRAAIFSDQTYAYQILTQNPDEKVMQLDVTRERGHLHFYEVTKCTVPKLWYLLFDGQLKAPGATGRYQNVTFEQVDKRVPYTYLGMREKDGWLMPVGRSDIGKYWYAKVDADGSGPLRHLKLVNDLHVIDINE
jgi:hypothetical protein